MKILLTKKNILLISPEPWGINRVSKHHYATELAKRGNNVYYLNPPTDKFNIKSEQKRLFIFDYKPTYRGLSKLPNFISAMLIEKQIKKLENKIRAETQEDLSCENGHIIETIRSGHETSKTILRPVEVIAVKNFK